MAGPGEYVADAAEGITRVEDLPEPKIVCRRRCFKRRKCPRCGHSSYRDRVYTRTLHDLGDLAANRPRDLVVTYSQHCCSGCGHYFHADLSDLAAPNSHYTQRVVCLAVRLVVEDGLPYRLASWHLWRDHRVFVPFATIQNWVEAGGKRAAERITQDYLDDALADFSGYIAADELYDGPYCVLSIVDNHRFKRLVYEVLDHNPTEQDITTFFRRFREALQARGLKLHGITTDGSPLYPKPIAGVFGAIPHKVCQFHVIAELNKSVLKAVAKVRRQLQATMPQIGRGRPTRAQRKLAARKQRLAAKVADLFEHRHLFVQHQLTPGERKTLHRITRGQPGLRTLRQIVDEAYRLFDRRCRTETAQAKLARLRQRVRRFTDLRQVLHKLFSPTLEKALTFLDDALLPATSNAVERGNRRHRKMQKMIYRVRTGEHIHQRIAVDMFRDAHAPARLHTIQMLHYERSG